MRLKIAAGLVAVAAFGSGLTLAANTATADAPNVAVTPAQDIGDAVSLPAPEWAGLAPCAQEDGPGPCVWHADETTNGVGLSFWIDCAQAFHYMDPAADEMYGGPGDAYPNTCA